MSGPGRYVDRAEEVMEGELEGLERDLELLVDRSREVAEAAKRLNGLREPAERLHQALRHAQEQAVQGSSTSREPREGDGEAVDQDHLEAVREARGEGP